MHLTTYMRGDAMVPEGGTIDLEPMLGRWINTNSETIYIERFETWLEEGRLMLRVFGVGTEKGAPIDWGAIDVQPYGNPSTLDPAGFHGHYRLEAVDVLLAVNYARGILVIQTYSTFSDGSGRIPYQTREFFHR